MPPIFCLALSSPFRRDPNPVGFVDIDRRGFLFAADAAEVSERVSAAFEGIDTGALDSSFMGLSDVAQSYAAAALADPSQRESLIETMPIAALEELIDFVSRMPDDEQAAVQRALLL